MGNNNFVFRLKPDDTVERILLTSGLEDADHVQPVAVLEVGDRIVVAGQTGLKDGSQVKALDVGLADEAEVPADEAASPQNPNQSKDAAFEAHAFMSLSSPQSPSSHFTTERPVAVLMVFVAAVVFGAFSFKRLPLTLMPELNYPTLTVRTEFEGAAPEEVENEVSRPIEGALGVVNGLSRISSVSRAGVSDVSLEFVWGTDMSQAAQDTLEKLDQVFLPREVDKPLILHFDPSLDPIMELSLSGEGVL